MISGKSGYISLVASLIILAAVVIIVAVFSQTAVLNRSEIAGSSFKETSRALSVACLNTALFKLSNFSSYAGNETIAVGSSTCDILPIESSSSARIIKTRGVFQNSYTNYKTAIGTSTLDIFGLEEVKSF